jgi:hypothetical protein
MGMVAGMDRAITVSNSVATAIELVHADRALSAQYRPIQRIAHLALHSAMVIVPYCAATKQFSPPDKNSPINVSRSLLAIRAVHRH